MRRKQTTNIPYYKFINKFMFSDKLQKIDLYEFKYMSMFGEFL